MREYVEKSFSQSSIIGNSIWSYIDKQFPTLSHGGVCTGLCIDYARHMISHKNNHKKGDYIKKLKGKFTFYGKSSKNFVNRIQSYQDIQLINFQETYELNLNNSNYLDSLDKKFKSTSLIYLSFITKEYTGHAITLFFNKNPNNNEISSYKIFDPNFGEYETSDSKECDNFIEKLYNYYGYTTCKALDLEKFIIENHLAKNPDNPDTKEYKYIEKNPNAPILKAMQLSYLCYKGETENVRLLLADTRIDVNKSDNNGWTPLNIACYECKTDSIKLLLEDARIDVNKPFKNGLTPLEIACYRGKTENIRLLLADRRIDLSKVNINDKNISDKVKTLVNAAIFKTKIIKTLQSTKVDNDLQENFNNLAKKVKIELAKQLQSDIKKLAKEAHTYNIKKIISIFPEEERMKYFSDLVKEAIITCTKQDNLKKVEIILDAFNKEDRNILIQNVMLTPLIPIVKTKLGINQLWSNKVNSENIGSNRIIR